MPSYLSQKGFVAHMRFIKAGYPKFRKGLVPPALYRFWEVFTIVWGRGRWGRRKLGRRRRRLV